MWDLFTSVKTSLFPEIPYRPLHTLLLRTPRTYAPSLVDVSRRAHLIGRALALQVADTKNLYLGKL